MRALTEVEIEQVGGGSVTSGVTVTLLAGSSGLASGMIAGTIWGAAVGGAVGAGVGALVGVGYTLATEEDS